jgi:hypothetical protein
MKTTKILTLLVLVLGLTAKVANADFTFGTPTNLGSAVNSAALDVGPSISADGLMLFFFSNRSGGYGRCDIYVATRATTNDEWGEPVNLGPTVNSSYGEDHPHISADGLSLFFNCDRAGGSGSEDIWVTTRATKADPWGTPVNLGPTVNSWSSDLAPSISADGLSLYFNSARPGGFGDNDIYVSTRATTDDPWGEPVNLGPAVNSSAQEWAPSISADSLSLYFSDFYPQGPSRPGGYGNADIWMTTRATKNDPWGEPVNLGPAINSQSHDELPSISADGLSLYFCSNRPGGVGGFDLWQASILPVVDFNGDGIVDSADMCIMIGHWGENYSLCDIGPTPLGDGVVDTQDLIVLAEHLFEEIFPTELIAYWKLDEIEGTIAEDSVGDKDGTLNGEPLWQPADGKVGGALQLDGIDDYVSTPFILDPAKGSFSAFAWIKSDAPGQVIISQTGSLGGTWLGTNSSEGKLMTGLSDVFFGALESESVITDSQWHHVGLVYDSASHRHLYVDGVEANVDSGYVAGMPSDGGLYIGAAKDLDANSFFSGLIDDVRIYNRAVIP